MERQIPEQDPAEEPPTRTRRLIFTGPDAGTQKPEEPAARPPEAPFGKLMEAPVTTAGPNDEELSVEELKRQQEELEQRIRERQAAEKKAVIDQIVAVVHTYNIPVEELVTALGGLKIKRQGQKAVQKYRDPVSGATWSGRGKEPTWIRGKKRDKFLIPN